ncbi:patatin-like phospholipase family protein [Mesohalobacter halotolerans]|jgi:predicted patatin/cPLA2 family phospholipase|uniref:Patatin-like phospholipase family protein n=1 Tax=Mesohalobacter halotolerans TaxID=1883405 RepID=A0A4U5TQ26_9FLAO|nr:patatin-like phospholipase family protein [Mesohalobacter halotolerans]MBS3739232.1 patatin-like phospholipase family protein [Psychroflexus sp.]NBC56793.1 patatin-like phospholipase family protein [Bacteroidota bacterium]TKS56267.1 patatin-like phospholipase family protein [Mesohalobacter halotolerans]
MKALVISGGGSKGAFAGGVAEYLIDVAHHDYKLFVGSSTGSLLISQLALGNTQKVKHIYTNVNQSDIFSLNPFIKRKEGDREFVTINYLNTVIQFIKRKRTFGESKNLRKTILKHFSKSEFEQAQCCGKDVVVTVSNLTKNKVEYKSIQNFKYEDFVDWIWMSSNLVPFMSLASKNGSDYADGGFGSMVPIREAVRRGATEIDAIILEAENMEHNKVLGKNPFSLMMNLFGFMLDQVEKHDVREGKLASIQRQVKLNLYYTPIQLTENSLIFNKKLMTQWWQDGFEYAKNKTAENKIVFDD